MLDSDAGRRENRRDQAKNANAEFEFGGINHVALVCSDMERTVDFYSNVLGMPLIKAVDLPGDGPALLLRLRQRDCVAFFWFADAPDGVPGMTTPVALPGLGEMISAVGSMNHLAFHVPEEKFDAYRQRLKKGVRVGPVLNHDESPMQVAASCIPAFTSVRSTSATRTESRSNSHAGLGNSPNPIPGRSRRRQLIAD